MEQVLVGVVDHSALIKDLSDFLEKINDNHNQQLKDIHGLLSGVVVFPK